MEYHGGGAERYILERNYAGIVPSLSLGIIHDEHVVGKVVAETQFVLIGLYFFLCGMLVTNVKHNMPPNNNSLYGFIILHFLKYFNAVLII